MSMLYKHTLLDINYNVNPNYTQDMCIIYSVYRTLELNGINPTEFLNKYSRNLHNYCREVKYTKALKDSHDINKQIKSWDMKALSGGFNYKDYPLFKSN